MQAFTAQIILPVPFATVFRCHIMSKSKLSRALKDQLKGGWDDYELWHFRGPSGKEVAAAQDSDSDIHHIKYIALHKENGPELNRQKDKYVLYVAYHGSQHKDRWYEEPVIDFLIEHHLPDVHNWLQQRLLGFKGLRKRFIDKSETIEDDGLRYELRVSNRLCTYTYAHCLLYMFPLQIEARNDRVPR
jgi:hypothetical protein